MKQRIVIDTNVYISRALRKDSVPAKAVDKAWLEATPLVSMATWTELRLVLNRPKFAPYVRPEDLSTFLNQAWEISELISVHTTIRACRDPRDDRFLELAVAGRADVLLTGDADLLALHPFQGIAIVTPAAFLDAGGANVSGPVF
jgi:uncharacterized protein